MFGKQSQLNSLESRKQLLLAESEINRARLGEEYRAMTGSVSNLADRMKSIGLFASAAAAVVGSVSAFRSGRSESAHKPSWLKTGLKVAKVAGSIWLALRARPQ